MEKRVSQIIGIVVVDRPSPGVDRYVPFRMRAHLGGRATAYRSERAGEGVQIDQIPGLPEVTVYLSHVTTDREPGTHWIVYQGEPVGTAELRGASSTADHLHLEVQIGGVPQDPMPSLSLPPRTSYNLGDPSSGAWFYSYVRRRSRERSVARVGWLSN
jgi:hypothetical protein